MLILPHGRDGYRYGFLIPQRRSEWRAPSRRIWPFEQENKRRFRVTGRLHDGAIRWRGWFDDREDADAFLIALVRFVQLGEPIPFEIARLPWPEWHPGLAELPLSYQFATVQFLTTTSASNQTFVVPGDISGGNQVDIIAHGGRGGNVTTSTNMQTARSGGGGAGSFARAENLPLTPAAEVTFRLRAGSSGTGTFNGSWFNGATFDEASVAAEGGSNGNNQSGSGSSFGGNGGSANANIGSLRYSGGRGGNASASGPGRGGAAAGPTGAGENGSATAAGVAVGQEYDSTHGSGSGGSLAAGNNYGGGGSGRVKAGSVGTDAGYAGAQALIVLTYGLPAASRSGMLLAF